jgi:hypothetical protein
LTVLSYGIVTPETTNLAFQNFVRPAMDVRSMSCTPIELLSNDGKKSVISTATGFFWKDGDDAFLVTNWHVVSGRSPFTGKVTTEQHYIPSQFSFYIPRVEVIGDKVAISRQRIEVTLGAEVSEILEKPPLVNGKSVDLWAMRLPPGMVLQRDPHRTGFPGAEHVTALINEAGERRIHTQAGDDCFLLGYPLRNYGGVMFPIWKRGSVASETSLGVDDRPMFLIDAATTPGMSGSPIIRRATMFTADNKDIGALQEMHAYEFIGVYAGRLQNKDLEKTNIGSGWYRSLIPAVVQQFESAVVEKLTAGDILG